MKKIFAGLFALIMVFTMLPFTASASKADFFNDYFPEGISKPLTPYIQLVEYLGDATTEQFYDIWYTYPEDIYKLNMDDNKDHDSFVAKYGIETNSLRLIVQFDCKVDDGDWLYDTGTFTDSVYNPVSEEWEDVVKPVSEAWDKNQYPNWGNYGLFMNYQDMAPWWYNKKMDNYRLIDSWSYDNDDKDNNGFLKDALRKEEFIHTDGTWAASSYIDNVNHTFTFRYRFLVSAEDENDYGNMQYIRSEWSDPVSVGKNGTQQDLTKNPSPEALTINDFVCNKAGSDTEPRNEFKAYVDIPVSVYEDERYYIIYENGFEPVGIQTQYRINGGAWKGGDVANSVWIFSGERYVVINDYLKKGDKVEIRMRVAEGNNKDIHSPWSNIKTVYAAVTDYRYKDEPAQPTPKPTPSPAPAVKPESAISSLTPAASENQVTKFVTSLKNDNDPKGAAFSKFLARQKKVSKNSVTLTWNKVSGAKTYVVYGNKCGNANRYEKISTVSSNSFTQKKLKKGTYYKYLVSAFDASGKHIATSCTVHIATKGGKFCNFKKVTTKAKKNKVTLAKKGKSFKLKAKAVKESKKLKANVHRPVRYESSDKKIATVDSKGKIKAKKKGACYVYAYAQNGAYSKIKVTVKK